ARLLPARRRRAIRRRRSSASWRRAAAQHLGRAALRRPPPRLRLSRRGDPPAPGPVRGPPGEGVRGGGGGAGWRADRGVPLADAVTYGPLAGTASSTCPADAPVSSTWTITVAPVAAIASSAAIVPPPGAGSSTRTRGTSVRPDAEKSARGVEASGICEARNTGVLMARTKERMQAVDGRHGARLEHARDDSAGAGDEDAGARRQRVERRREGNRAAVGDGGTGEGAERARERRRQRIAGLRDDREHAPVLAQDPTRGREERDLARARRDRQAEPVEAEPVGRRVAGAEGSAALPRRGQPARRAAPRAMRRARACATPAAPPRRRSRRSRA